ncbi:MAG: STAS domain-containing protein [Spirochaetes bacterium]|nr:STAS domain-containing protein [Spirochaetota bacterium]MBN2770279.1 STAS domain-containing protein [Spirochaetota bacterium]HRX14760.1 STAS domain-containing protein [Spirochaetota bacterium]
MKITVNTQNNTYFLILDGKFNIDHIDVFDENFHSIIKNKPDAIAINLQNVEYIDSSALGSLIKGLNLCKKLNIKFYLCDLKENINLVFKLSYLDKFFNIVSSSEIN